MAHTNKNYVNYKLSINMKNLVIGFEHVMI